MPPSKPGDSIITRKVTGSIRRQLARSNGLLQLPSASDVAHQLVHGAPTARVLSIVLEQMADRKIRMTVDTGVEKREGEPHSKSYVLEPVTAINATATAATLVDLLAHKEATTIRTFSLQARRQSAALRVMDIQECTEWLETLAGQSDMRSQLTFRRPNPRVAIQIGEN